jgi:hypothetical protein
VGAQGKCQGEDEEDEETLHENQEYYKSLEKSIYNRRIANLRIAN